MPKPCQFFFQNKNETKILTIVTILISIFRVAALIRKEALISIWIPKSAALISGPALIRGKT